MQSTRRRHTCTSSRPFSGDPPSARRTLATARVGGKWKHASETARSERHRQLVCRNACCTPAATAALALQEHGGGEPCPSGSPRRPALQRMETVPPRALQPCSPACATTPPSIALAAIAASPGCFPVGRGGFPARILSVGSGIPVCARSSKRRPAQLPAEPNHQWRRASRKAPQVAESPPSEQAGLVSLQPNPQLTAALTAALCSAHRHRLEPGRRGWPAPGGPAARAAEASRLQPLAVSEKYPRRSSGDGRPFMLVEGRHIVHYKSRWTPSADSTAALRGSFKRAR